MIMRRVASLLALALLAAPSLDADAEDCRAGTLYLTFDTGTMQVAELIARTLEEEKVRATFFLANEKEVACWRRSRVWKSHLVAPLRPTR